MNVISSSLQILNCVLSKNKNRVCKEALSFPYDFMQYLHILVQIVILVAPKGANVVLLGVSL